MSKSHRTYSMIAVLVLVIMTAGPLAAQIDIRAAVPPGGLDIQKTVSTRLVYAGDSIDYTLYVINNSDDIINDLRVVDTLSFYAEYVDGSASNGGVYDPSSRVLSWDLGSMYGGDTTTLTFTLATDPNAVDTAVVLNHAFVFNPRVNVKSNWTITWVKPVYKSVLSIVKTSDVYTADPGDTVAYNIHVENSGNIAVSDIEIIDSLPREAEPIQNTITNGGMYDPAYHIIRWSAVSLDPGAGIDFGYNAVISSSILDTTEIDNIAVIPLPNDSSISDTSTITVTPEPPVPNITVDKIADRDTVGFGETIGYTIRVANSGTGAGHDIEVVDVVSDDLEVDEASISHDGSYISSTHQITWIIETIAPGETIDLAFDASVVNNYLYYEIIRNLANLYFNDAILFDTTRTVLEPYGDVSLSIEKTADREFALIGDTINYQIEVSADGEIPYSNVPLLDILPDYVEVIESSITLGGAYDQNTNSILWTLPAVYPGASVFQYFSVVVADNAPIGTTLINTALVNMPELNIYDTARTIVVEELKPQFEIIKEVDKPRAQAGDTLVYTVNAMNRGTADAVNVTIVDELPNGTTLLDDPVGAEGVYDPSAHSITWLIENLAAMSGEVVRFRVRIDDTVTTGTTLENVALFDLPEEDISDTATTIVTPPEEADLNIEKTVDKPIARAGDTLNYSLVIENTGSASARNIPVIDTVPAFTTLVGNSINQGGVYDPDSREIRWLIAELAPEMNRTLNFAATIDDDAVVGTGIVNTGIIDLPEFPILDTATTIVDEQIGEPKLTIDKTVDKDTVYVGDTLHYNIRVANVGNAVSGELAVADNYAYPLRAIESTINAYGILVDPINGMIRWDIDNLAPAEFVDLQFSAIVLDIAAEQDTAVNAAGLIYPDQPFADTVSTIVLKRGDIDLNIEKTVIPDSAGVNDTVHYSIEIANRGETPYSGLVFDNVPSALNIIVNTISDNGTFNAGTSSIVWFIENLTSEGSMTLHYDAVTPLSTNSDVDTLRNIVHTYDNTVADTAYLYVHNPSYPVLTIDKAADKDTTVNGDVINYSLTVRNLGGFDDGNVYVVDEIPEYTSYVEGSANMGGVYDAGSNSLSWTLEGVPAEGEVTLNFQVQVDYTGYVNSSITNIGQIILGDSTVADTAVTTVLGNPLDFELDIDKQVDRATARAGDLLTYSITVENTGEGDAYEFYVYDEVPAEVRLNRNSLQNGGTFDPETGLVTWPVDILGSGETLELSFMAVIRNETAPGTDVMNVALAEIGEITVADTVYTEVLPPVELPFTIVKSVDSTVAARSSILNYRIAIKNISEEPLSNIIFWDNVPDQTSYVPGSVTGSGRYDEQTNRVTWDWSDASIAPGHTINLSFKVRIFSDAPDDYIIDNTAFAEIDLPDEPVKIAAPMLIDTVASNTVETIVNVPTGPQDDPVIVKSVNFTEAAPGNTLMYTVTVSNPGPDPVNPLIVHDAIPNLTSYVAGSASHGGVYNAIDDRVEWTYGPMAVNDTVRFTFEVQIDGEATDGEEIRNRANVVAPVPVLGNEVVTTVRAGEFFLIKRVSQTTAYPGDTLTYTLIYNNATEVDQTNISIFDQLHTSLEYVSGSATGGGIFNSNVLVWNPGNVTAGTIDSVRFRAVVADGTTAGTSINNFGNCSGSTIPTIASNEVITTVLALPEDLIELSKRAENPVVAPGDTVEYRIRINNRSNSPITNAVIVDAIPEHFTYVDGSAHIEGTPLNVTRNIPLVIEIGTVPAYTEIFVFYRLVVDDDTPFNETFRNSAVLTGVDNMGRGIEVGPVSADVYVGESMLRITKSTNSASGTIGSVIPFTITIENISQVTVTNIALYDSMSAAFDYIEGSSYINGAINAEPTGSNPYVWLISELGPGETLTLTYSAQLTTAAGPGTVENVAWAEGSFGTATVRTANVIARVDVFGIIIPGSIRGRLIVDCDGDKVTEYPDYIADVDIYLESGSMSRTNEKGMFYFSTVKAGTHIVAVDTRDLKGQGFRLADGEPSSVFVHVNEAGETYVYFRVCPMLSLKKEAGLVPKIKVTKTAHLNREAMTDSSGVMVDYEIKIQSNEWYSKTLLKVVDSFPDETRLIIHDTQPIVPSERNNVLTYEVNIEEREFNQSVYYSLEDLAPGIRRFLTNKIYLEGQVFLDSTHSYPIKSYPTEVQVGPFKRIPGQDILVNVIGAYFESAKARLLTEAFPVLSAIADTMKKYEDADIRVIGHCDWRPISTTDFPSNWELSEARAKSVSEWLVDSAGIARDRIEFKGMAATQPVDTSWTMDGMDRNRRVEIFVKSFKEGKVDLSQITEEKWSSYTILEIEPIDIDTLFKMPSRPIESGLADTWEVYLLIDAAGKDDIDNVTITDIIPAQAEYVEGSASYAGRSLIPEVTSDGKIIFRIDEIVTDSEAGLIYRIKTNEGIHPDGGGKAILEINDSGKMVNSNPVFFEPASESDGLTE